jgi:hypothetical protein
MQKISSYIIFTRSVEDIAFQVEMLYGSSSWDSRGLFLVVVAAEVPNSEQLALSVIRELWQIGRGYNVVVLVQQDGLLNLYTWFPYSSPDNCADVNNVVLINQWVMEGEGMFLREESLYPSKIPSNFQGCTVSLTTHMKGGIEDKFYNQYFVTHNITSNYVDYSDFSSDLEDVVSFLQNLWARESDMLFGSIPIVPKDVFNAEPTVPYFSMKFNWFVPCPKPFSRLRRISHIFSPSVWAAIVVVLLLVTVASCCLAKQSNDIRRYSTMPNALYNIWAVTVGVCVTGMPRSLRLKLLFVVFVFYCSAINTVFQTFLTSFVIDPGYENQLNSLDEILDSGIEFGYPTGGYVYFSLSSDLRHKVVLERGEFCSDFKVCLDRIHDTGNFAVFTVVWEAQNYTNIINDHGTICLLNDNDYDFVFITTYVQKGSFFLELLNKYISLSIESGMISRLAKDIIHMSRFTRNNVDVSDGYFVFTLSHLSIAFYILFFGLGLSFLLFLCEVFYRFKLRHVRFCKLIL